MQLSITKWPEKANRLELDRGAVWPSPRVKHLNGHQQRLVLDVNVQRAVVAAGRNSYRPLLARFNCCGVYPPRGRNANRGGSLPCRVRPDGTVCRRVQRKVWQNREIELL